MRGCEGCGLDPRSLALSAHGTDRFFDAALFHDKCKWGCAGFFRHRELWTMARMVSHPHHRHRPSFIGLSLVGRSSALPTSVWPMCEVGQGSDRLHLRLPRCAIDRTAVNHRIDAMDELVPQSVDHDHLRFPFRDLPQIVRLQITGPSYRADSRHVQ